MEIRKANKEDLETLFNFEKYFLSPFSKEQVLYEIVENPTSYILLAFENDVPVGFIDFWITFDSATICQIAVHEQFRKNGVGSKLLEESFKILKENDVLFYTLEVRENNLAAVKLYEKLGFEKVTIKPAYYDNGDNAIYMMKGIL